jgi:hypothetical protein
MFITSDFNIDMLTTSSSSIDFQQLFEFMTTFNYKPHICTSTKQQRVVLIIFEQMS